MMSATAGSMDEKLTIAKVKKEAGNNSFKSGDYKAALRSYHEAILFVQGLDKSPFSAMNSTDTVDAGSANEKKVPKTEVDLLLVTLYNNIAAIHMKLGNWKRALESAEKVLARDEDNAKAGFRKAQALVQLGDRPKGIKLLEHLSQLHPNDPDILRELQTRKADEQKSEEEHDKAFKAAWKGKFTFNRDKQIESSAPTLQS